MPIEDSRNKNGTLTLDGDQYEVQATSVALVPSTDEEGDPVETLSGDTITADDVTTWELQITAIQDFEDPAGILEFLRANAGDVVTYDWKPGSTAVPHWSGNVKVRPATIGGNVNERLTSEIVLPCQEAPTVDYTP
jgi:hypothetical protein